MLQNPAISDSDPTIDARTSASTCGIMHAVFLRIRGTLGLGLHLSTQRLGEEKTLMTGAEESNKVEGALRGDIRKRMGELRALSP